VCGATKGRRWAWRLWRWFCSKCLYNVSMFNLAILDFPFMHTFVLRAADFAVQVGFATGVVLQKVAAVGTEDKRSDGGHGCD
jgi:hypothetical protein